MLNVLVMRKCKPTGASAPPTPKGKQHEKLHHRRNHIRSLHHHDVRRHNHHLGDGRMKMTDTQRSRAAKKAGLVQAPRGFVAPEQAKVIQMWVDEGNVTIGDDK